MVCSPYNIDHRRINVPVKTSLVCIPWVLAILKRNITTQTVLRYCCIAGLSECKCISLSSTYGIAIANLFSNGI